jgi:hypothetical protein
MWLDMVESLLKSFVKVPENIVHQHLRNIQISKNGATLQYIWFSKPSTYLRPVDYTGIFFGGGDQQIQLRSEDRENGDLGAVAP